MTRRAPMYARFRATVPYPPAAAVAFDVCEPVADCYDAAMPESPKPPDPSRSLAATPIGAELAQVTEIGNAQIFRVAIEAGNKIVLPAAVRERLGVAEGDYLVLEPQPNGTVVVISLKQIVRQAQGVLRDVAPGVSLVDELIAERREEARRENEE
jgi:AbrB family looped-hinge helix DNA binding protein